ncbi:MAG: hypothetical protein ACWA44_07285 [Thiotrichales bacterium]
MHPTISEPLPERETLESIIQPVVAFPSSTTLTELRRHAEGLTQSGIFVTSESDTLLGWVSSERLLGLLLSDKAVEQRRTLGQIMEPLAEPIAISTPLDEVVTGISKGEVRVCAGQFCCSDAGGRFAGVVAVEALLQLASRHRVVQFRPASSETWIETLLTQESLFVVVSIRVAISSGFQSADSTRQRDLEAALTLVDQSARRIIDKRLDACEYQPAERQLMVVFKSQDWFERCEALLHCFETPGLSSDPSTVRWDRGSECSPVDPIKLSFGAVVVEPGRFASRHEVLVAAARSVARAELVSGNVIHLDEPRFSESGGRRALIH